jgi:serine/threonine protein kinase
VCDAVSHIRALYTTIIAVTNMMPYEVLRELGEGGFGLVVLARLKASENVSIASPSGTDLYADFPAQLVAVKKIAFKGHRSVLELPRIEIRVLRRSKHVHVVRFIDYDFSPENDTIIME